MKNNTKIRLHLSKQLFEALTKQVLAEAKANDGYSVAVKQPKAMKEVNAVKSTDKMKKMEEKMSSKEKMAKGLYKEDAGALQPGEKVSWKDGSQREYKGVVQSQEGGDYYKVKVTSGYADGHKEGSILTKQSGDLSKDMAEGDLNESEAVDAALTGLGVLGAGGLSYAIMKLQDLLQKKDPKAYAKLQKVSGTMSKANPGLDV